MSNHTCTAQEAQQELKKKLRKLNAFMDQRETTPLLAIQVRDSFLVRMVASLTSQLNQERMTHGHQSARGPFESISTVARPHPPQKGDDSHGAAVLRRFEFVAAALTILMLVRSDAAPMG